MEANTPMIMEVFLYWNATVVIMFQTTPERIANAKQRTLGVGMILYVNVLHVYNRTRYPMDSTMGAKYIL